MSERAWNNNINCQNCSISQLCLPYTLDNLSLDKLDDIIERKRPYRKGEQLFQAGQPLKALYAVRSGSFKSFTVSNDGDAQITAFHLPGDLIGFDSIHSPTYTSFAESLETSMVCEIPFQSLEKLSDQLPLLRRQVMRLMSSEISADKQMLSLLNNKNAEQRLATFLLDFSERFKSRGLSSKEFRLSMTRAEVGNFLGLTVETVSRLLSKLHKSGVIQVDGKFILLQQIDALQQLAGVQLRSCLTP
ncbi:fumarate/nitrate reduction transcriptional regulator Fnr [Aliidiomarina maris]|uniref:CRP/FNR family transcriptional regulator n=1 Tax=Aliidiomarina maris TaxID=531312 RepID=A0A327X1Z2_9GAMM|nr:fumarate/nitrate reduction transcriptional regulator Fnr [Aliidiomarina maris]MCL5051502.1 fumarate/nitrate reduction transcriptional regulator Fnr [Bacillota bacterium]RAJ98913.1 CRP/FNR family transcriptional regulator [Aliidiomarina maris]RUO25056.1 transcriptional regulator FNR [Aliidiomarina maris]